MMEVLLLVIFLFDKDIEILGVYLVMEKQQV